MIIDSDDDDAAASAQAPYVDKPLFEDALSDDQDNVVPEIVQTLDLSFGTAVRRIACLPLAPCVPEDAPRGLGQDLVKHKIIIALSCANTEAFVLTVPLTPPSHQSKARPELARDLMASRPGRGLWGEAIVSLSGLDKPCDTVAVTLHSPTPLESDRGDAREGGPTDTEPPLQLIVAASSSDASGTLRLWSVDASSLSPPTQSAAKRQPRTSGVHPFQLEYLPSPLSAIAFNPTRSSHLLVVDPTAAARVYDFATSSLPHDDASVFPTYGSWLLSLYAPFARGTGTTAGQRRRVLDAQWISRGRAVLALLADGAWGIWDVDGAGPGGRKKGISSGRDAPLFNSFAASGPVDGFAATPLRNPAAGPAHHRSSGSGVSASGSFSGEFMPMTPATRRESALMASSGGVGTAGSVGGDGGAGGGLFSSNTPERLAAVRGGISVTALSERGSGGAQAPEEAAVLWMAGADHVVVIPAVARFWEAQVRRQSGGRGVGAGGSVNLFTGAGVVSSRMVRLGDLGQSLLGERCCCVAAVPTKAGGGAAAEGEASKGSSELPIEVLAAGDTRLIFVGESEEGIGARIGGVVGWRARRARAAAGGSDKVSAIMVDRRPEKPASVMFNLTVAGPARTGAAANGSGGDDGDGDAVRNGGGKARGAGRQQAPRPARRLLDSGAGAGEGMDLDGDADAGRPEGRAADGGFAFTARLDHAADADVDAEARDVDEEVRDIMEIERELELMEHDRATERQNVFFEDM